MIDAGGHIVTVEDDAKLRVWDAAGEAVARTASLPGRGFRQRNVAFVASASALAVAYHDRITMIPLGGGALETHTLEHYDNPQFLFAAGAPALAVYAYPARCGLGFVDLGSFALAGKTVWAPACLRGELAWSVPDPVSDRFMARVTTLNRREPYKVEGLLLGSYRSREIACRVDGSANDAAFGGGGDFFTAHDDTARSCATTRAAA